MERLRDLALLALLGACAAGLLLFPAESADAARQGLMLCLETVLPTLFPFFALSSLLIACGGDRPLARALERWMRPLFGLSGAGAGALALGLVGGYPVGARTAAELYRAGRLEKSEAERLLGFCNNAGPGFLFGICGGAVFRSVRAGALLYLVHVGAALLTGALLRPRGAAPTTRRTARPAPRQTLAAAFPRAVQEAFFAAWSACGFITLFLVLLRFLTLLLPPVLRAPPYLALLSGTVELTNGVLALTNDPMSFACCAAMLGWGGLSVHAQTLSALEGSGLGTRYYFLGKLLQAALSVPLAMLAARAVF